MLGDLLASRACFATLQSRNLDRYCVTGRVYHPEHIHGHRQYGERPTEPLLLAGGKFEVHT
eukprot:1157833-Pelagomonas_calceolata.AAC.2